MILRWPTPGGLRNEKPLTEEQKRQVMEYAVFLGMPTDRILFLDHGLTAYWCDLDYLMIGTDVVPLTERSRNPNGNVSIKGTIAHEVIGHRESQLRGLTQENNLLEEAQASIRAASFALNLSRPERCDLLKDGIYRLNKRDIYIRTVKNKLHVNER